MNFKKPIKAWHFLKADWTTGKGNLAVKVGKPLVHTGDLVPCAAGLHASVRAIDALRHAPSSLVTLVWCTPPIVKETDKFVCTSRTVVWGYNADEELGIFARQCALGVLSNWQQEVPKVVIEWLETGDPDLRSSAYSAAYSAAESASSAARSARSAAESAAWSAAESARSAAESAAESPAESAAECAQNTMLESLLINGALNRGLTTKEDL